MTREEIFEFIHTNPVFHLATIDNGKPRVRGMLTYSADESGIVFHTGAMRDVHRQIELNPNVELCYNDYNAQIQVRVYGELTQVTDTAFKDEVAAHPSRTFLTPWRASLTDEEFHRQFIVYRMEKPTAIWWKMSDNFAPKTPVSL